MHHFFEEYFEKIFIFFVYFVKKNVAELEGNVVITKNGNMVKGDKAISDFTTSKSRLIAKNGGRISGKLIESTLKEKKDK